MKNSIIYSSFNMNTNIDYKKLIELQATGSVQYMVVKKPNIKVKTKKIIKLRNR